MRIAITADLHLGNTPKRLIKSMAEEIAQNSPDAIVLAGDIGEVLYSLKYFRECIEIFVDTLKVPCLVIPGNHDLWTKTDVTSLSLFNDILPQMTKDAGAVWLQDGYFLVGDIGVVGSYLHYDYSGRDTVGACADFSDEYYAKNKWSINNDAEFLKGLPSDIEFANKLGIELCNQLQLAQDDDRVKHIVIATHVPCLEEQTCRRPHDFNWSRGTPYFANLTYRQNILSANKVRCVVSGHSHQGRKEDVMVGDRVISVVNLDSDYKNPSYIIVGIEK